MNCDADQVKQLCPGDFGMLSSAFGSVEEGPNWISFADLDGDTEVGPSDFEILSAHFGESGY